MIGKILRLADGMIVVPFRRDGIVEEFECTIILDPDHPRGSGEVMEVSRGELESAVEYKLFGRSQRRGKKTYERFSIGTEWV